MSTSTSHQETRSLGLLAAVAIVGLAFFAALLLPLIPHTRVNRSKRKGRDR